MIAVEPDLSKPQKIAILGYGVEGKSTFSYLRRLSVRHKIIIIDDIKIEDLLSSVSQYAFDECEEELASADLIFKSPGISWKTLSLNKYVSKITSQTEIFLSKAKGVVIGVTGTLGKSTTCQLLCEVMKNASMDVLLGGNIGVPLFDILEKTHANSYSVVELSSHQLMHVNKSPHIAVLLNIFHEHLDYYENFQEYKNAKLNIIKAQSEKDYCFVEKELLKDISPLSIHSKLRSFSTENISADIFMQDRAIHINNKLEKIVCPIDFPWMNCLLPVLGVMDHFAIDERCLQKSLSHFKGLEHRVQELDTMGSLTYFDDSISTIPESTLAAIKFLKRSEMIETIIIGGMDRGVSWSAFMNEIIQEKIPNVILMGEMGRMMMDRINAEEIESSHFFYTKSMQEAVQISWDRHCDKGLCLLSPAASSFDDFKDFKDRGRQYLAAIKQLKKELF